MAFTELDPPSTDSEDTDPSNVIFRAGYLRALANKLEGDDREYVLRATRSLEEYYKLLTSSPASPGSQTPGSSPA